MIALTEPMNPVPRLELAGASLTDEFGVETILQDISCTIAAGEFVAIAGASGAGKTSLLRLLNGLISPTAGRIFLDGRELPALPILELRRQVVLVLQEPKLLEMTVAEALAYPLQLQKLPAAVVQARLATWRDRLGIPDAWLDRREAQLSLGQRQVVAIARALVMEPRVLLLDEPTSALDVGTAERVLSVLAACRREGLTVLMVNHQLEWAAKFSDRALLLADGRLQADLPAHQVDWEAWRSNLRAAAQAAQDDTW